jgi:hypothetical protein
MQGGIHVRRPFPQTLDGMICDRGITITHLSTTRFPCKGLTLWAPYLRVPWRGVPANRPG